MDIHHDENQTTASDDDQRLTKPTGAPMGLSITC
jgi:hypothetical protein